MTLQSYSVTGNRKLFPNQSADLNARLQGLPNLMALQQTKKQYEEEKAYRERSLEQQKEIADKELSFQREQDKTAFGLEMTKLGTNLATGPNISKTTFGDIGDKFKSKPPSTYNARYGSEYENPGNTTPKDRGFFSKMNPGSMMAGGLSGFGMGTMFSKEPTERKLLYGGAAGLLTGFLSGGGWSGALSGGLGGLFGGLVS
jgi:hypothetical protein